MSFQINANNQATINKSVTSVTTEDVNICEAMLKLSIQDTRTAQVSNQHFPSEEVELGGNLDLKRPQSERLQIPQIELPRTQISIDFLRNITPRTSPESAQVRPYELIPQIQTPRTRITLDMLRRITPQVGVPKTSPSS